MFSVNVHSEMQSYETITFRKEVVYWKLQARSYFACSWLIIDLYMKCCWMQLIEFLLLTCDIIVLNSDFCEFVAVAVHSWFHRWLLQVAMHKLESLRQRRWTLTSTQSKPCVEFPQAGHAMKCFEHWVSLAFCRVLVLDGSEWCWLYTITCSIYNMM